MTSKLKLLMDQYDRTINSKLEEENNLSVAMESMETNNLEEKKCEHLHVTNWICDKCGVDTLRERRSEVLSPSDKTWEERCTNPKCHNFHAPSKYCLCDTKKQESLTEDQTCFEYPTEKDYEDMYVSLGKNETEKMERRFNIWLENRDDDFTLDIWDFRCLQDFIQQELTSATIKAKEEERESLKKAVEKLDTFCRHKNTLYPEGSERFNMDDMVLLADIEATLEESSK